MLHTVLRSVVKTVFDEAAVGRRKDAVELMTVERLHPQACYHYADGQLYACQ